MSSRRARRVPTDPDLHEHDLGLAHDMRTMLSRRRMLAVFGAAGTAALAACSTGGSTSTSAAVSATTASSTTAAAMGECVAAAPQETAGPYPGDGSNGPNVLIESGIVRRDLTTSFGSYTGTAEGVPTTVTLHLQDLAADCAAGAGMAVYLWHCDRDGNYSLYSEGVTEQNYLRGVQVAGADGTVSFTSIFPACYSGRWPHIHFEVYDSLEVAVAGDNARLTSQIALPQDVCETVYAQAEGYSQSTRNLAQVGLDSDNVFGDGWDAELATVSGSIDTGYAVDITIGVAEKSANVQSDMPPQGGMGGGPAGGRPAGPPAGQ
ncbi:intradiol ring-cleavage dioxygenase [Rhodococcus ruber]|uniref:Putative protocatechuate dioxygenase n=1 Tax=Rhodococcus ruber TaxID=1830 RepID=A0A098BEX9_9NOCA|nr:intradiol ring-cleavage dioxygenase [Rhodococcus ruber]MCD2129071.1 intradiol ring-cleavage dioxygenase [Rhodococcus ruber]MCZ4504743.1 intradiol ring-cleavage dioxygenase [Rhodococcus ruber]MCZ4532298.1 intradiol ring-cleavage dioxygenase [Rhodococcus ruber]MCZ4622855.1 intradiol ring-cleavage dioxygenase [Rhodococcus ruber]MDI9969078.1 intradiol ring-cleavage dioxygenase [Rhodococcus ruber]